MSFQTPQFLLMAHPGYVFMELAKVSAVSITS